MRSRLTAAAFVVTLAAIPVAGILQYRWIDRVAEAEQERDTARVRNALNRLASEFDAEITRAHMAFGPGPMPLSGAAWLGERMTEWTSRAPVPQVIAEAWLIPSDDEPGVRIDRSGVIIPALRGPAEFDRTGPPPWRGPGAAVGTVDGRTALIMPTMPRPFRGPPPDGPRPEGPPLPPPATRVIILDDAFLTGTFIPSLVHRHLGDGQYDVEVVRTGTDVSRADATVSLLSVRPDCLMDRPGGGRGRGMRGPGMRVFVPHVDVLGLPARDCGPAEMAHWTLVARSRGGSLASAAASFRTRSLAASAGVLLLLSGAVIALWVSVHRARVLAQRQVEFATAVSHELRTPLTVMRLAGDNLASGMALTPEQTRRYGETIRREAERLGNMVEQVLTFARAQRPDWSVRKAPVDPAAVVEGALAACDQVLRDSGVEVIREVEPNLRPVNADSNLMISAVTNLLTNAARHGSSGKWVRVRAYGNEDSVVFEVADRGPGIGSRDIRHIFKPFYRGHGAAKTKGTGLGLHLVQRIAAAHGGSVSVESASGAGAAVRIRLPREVPA